MAKTKKKKPSKRINVRIGKKHHSRPRKSGGRTVGRTKQRRPKKRAAVGAIKAGTLKQIGWMAVGVGGGLALTHFVLRPIEKKITDKWPKIGMALPGGEIFLGGMMALLSKNSLVKAAGVGILAGGAEGVLKQLKIYKSQPALNGTDEIGDYEQLGDYTDVKVPISGRFTSMVAGILEDSRRGVYTRQVAGPQRNSHTETVADTMDINGGDFEPANEETYVKY